MGVLTIRNVDDAVKLELRKKAAARGVSMEQYLRDLVTETATSSPRRNLSVDQILSLAVKPKQDFDLKKVSDELYSYLEEE